MQKMSKMKNKSHAAIKNHWRKQRKVRKVAFEIKTEYLLEEDTPQVIE